LQKTIKNITGFQGVGLHTGKKVSVKLIPAETDFGIIFKRVDLKDNNLVPATINNVFSTERRTVLQCKKVKIETVEHLMASIYALSITNLLIEVDGPEIPILDGSAKLIIKKLHQTGLRNQNAQQNELSWSNYFKVEDGDSKIEFFPCSDLDITVKIDYESSVLNPQIARLKKLQDFESEIAPSRTFCFLHELSHLLNKNLIKGGNIENSIVFVEEKTNADNLGKLKMHLSEKVKIIEKGILNNKNLYFKNEQARHKLLDLIGDLALSGCLVKGKIVATKPGHKINTIFTKKLISLNFNKMKTKKSKPIMKINEIKKILPHREPFLFIDEIIEITNESVTGLKYVKSDEYYFKGHFPGAPVMPGVLQVEAMAQTGGILALNSVEDPENYLTYFMKIDKVKFKQKVEPDCTLIFKLKLLSPIRRGICHMEAKAYVDDTIVTEAELMAKIVKEKNE